MEPRRSTPGVGACPSPWLACLDSCCSLEPWHCLTHPTGALGTISAQPGLRFICRQALPDTCMPQCPSRTQVVAEPHGMHVSVWLTANAASTGLLVQSHTCACVCSSGRTAFPFFQSAGMVCNLLSVAAADAAAASASAASPAAVAAAFMTQSD